MSDHVHKLKRVVERVFVIIAAAVLTEPGWSEEHGGVCVVVVLVVL